MTYKQIMGELMPLEEKLDAIELELKNWWCDGFYHVEGEDNISPDWEIKLETEAVNLRRKIACLTTNLMEAV